MARAGVTVRTRYGLGMTDRSRSSRSSRRRGFRLRARWRLAMRGVWALPALYAGSIAESTALPWPIEIPMLAYMLRGRRQTVVVTLVVSAGSVTGCFLAYLAGAAALEALQGFIAARPGMEAGIAQSSARIEALGPLAVFLAMLAPVPVQLASFAAGAAGMAAPYFLLAAAIGRTLRYAAMGVLVFAFGPSVMAWWSERPTWVRRAAAAGIMLVFLVLFGFTLAAFV
jgi:membrane protein YqaA with SNARE-associated domain